MLLRHIKFWFWFHRLNFWYILFIWIVVNISRNFISRNYLFTSAFGGLNLFLYLFWLLIRFWFLLLYQSFILQFKHIFSRRYLFEWNYLLFFYFLAFLVTSVTFAWFKFFRQFLRRLLVRLFFSLPYPDHPFRILINTLPPHQTCASFCI